MKANLRGIWTGLHVDKIEVTAMNEPAPVNIAQKVVRYTRALSRWIKAGRPIRTEAEIIEIFEQDCRRCEAYETLDSSCRHCGCRVNTSTVAPINKIAMQTEHCPQEKW